VALFDDVVGGMGDQFPARTFGDPHRAVLAQARRRLTNLDKHAGVGSQALLGHGCIFGV
jgi:hypothetical protein